MTSAGARKAELRTRLLAARAAMPPQERDAAAARLAGHGIEAFGGAATVAAYLSVGAEPPTRLLVERLAATGARVLLPVVAGARLRWAFYQDQVALAPGRFGIPEPTGPPLDADALAGADVVLVPALAVDRWGTRLGRGGGYYDRALAGLTGRAVAVVYDTEVLDELPREPHDRRVGSALTPGGLRALG